MLKMLAIIVGIIFIVVGIMGFIPGFMTGDMLMGSFRVNTAHNTVHIVSGIIALWTGFTSRDAAKMFFQIFGIVYALVGIAGFFYGDQMLLGLIANNMADSWLHVVLGAIFIYLGFCCCCKKKKKK